LIAAARQRWRTASRQAGAILADEHRGQGTIVNGEMTDFERTMARTGQALGQVFEHLDAEHERTHTQALQALGLVGMLAVGAFVVALAFMALGVWLINRSLVASTDELVQGALRLAAGDRTHMVKVRIPPELAHVANAFNSMAGQLVEQEQALAREARTDGLTGLYNRRELDRTLADELQRAERHGQPVALVLIDVDHFKRFNDSHGHLGGDDALRAVAATLRANVRAVDRACRFGGEEFAVVLPASDAEAARVTAERIRAGIAGLAIELTGGETPRVTVSLGVAAYPGDGTTPEDLLGSADAALYQSKAQGRDRVTVAHGRLQASAARPAGGEFG
jgi:diguanylate cyclase (GGDEF)-like protein